MDDQMQDSVEEFQTVFDRILSDPLFDKVVFALVGLVVIYILGRLIRRSAARYIRDDKSRYRSRKLIAFGTFLLALLFLSIVFSDRLGGLTVAFGVAGAGIAFALQEVIVSIAGWVAISFGDIFKTGDRIKIGGVVGDVIDVSVIRTTLMECGDWVNGDLYNGRVVRIANSFVFKEPIFNYSGDFPFLWDEITFPIRYGSDLEFARRIFRESADQVVGEFSEHASKVWSDMVQKYLVEGAVVEPMVTMRPDENWVTFTVRYVVDFKRRRSVKDRLFRTILAAVDQHAELVSVASASQEITLMPASSVDLHTSGQGLVR